MAKDKIGNGLKVGDLVQIELSPGHGLMGRISAINEGGMLLPGSGKQSDMVMPGEVIVALQARELFDPKTGQCSSVLKVIDPDPDEADMIRRLVAEKKASKSGLLVH